MDYNSIASIQEEGFKGFETIGSMMQNACQNVPHIQGVYFVLNQNHIKDFLEESTGGWFKKKNPSVEQNVLEQNWVNDAIVLNMGKAGGSSSSATLNSRLKQYMNFGQGKPVGHWGGRLIWQLSTSSDLVICWKELLDDEPREVEKAYIQDFIHEFGKRPFANLTG
ncbi:MAG: hypothetical protein HOD11_13230 [Candidatus Marinimicrobia bacterium]|jgi:hypothetical protein|nr:hypothetical protein [Candidatus Neomarinimicrobiota bacterium]MBT4419736.1 hypothetical protein [Candidatus Neomarinimicrobiota bacterium]